MHFSVGKTEESNSHATAEDKNRNTSIPESQELTQQILTSDSRIV